MGFIYLLMYILFYSFLLVVKEVELLENKFCEERVWYYLENIISFGFCVVGSNVNEVYVKEYLMKEI